MYSFFFLQFLTVSLQLLFISYFVLRIRDKSYPLELLDRNQREDRHRDAVASHDI